MLNLTVVAMEQEGKMLKFRDFIIKYKFIILLYSLICVFIAGLCIYKGSKFVKYTFTEDTYTVTYDNEETKYVTEAFSLRPGNYAIIALYESNVPGFLYAKIDNSLAEIVGFDASLDKEGNVSYAFSIDYPTDRAVIEVSAPGNLGIQELSIISDKVINTDAYFLSVLFLIIPFLLSYLFYKILNKNYDYIFVVLLTFVMCIPMLFEHGLRFGIDIRDHLYRIQGLYMGMLEKQFPVVLYPNMNNEHGQIGVLYPALFLYPAAILRLLGVSVVTAYKTLAVIINLCTATSAYYCLSKICKKKWAIYAGVIVYVLDPLRLYSMYRGGGACGIGIASIFMPLVAYGMINILFFEKKDWQILSIGFAGLMCSHIISLVLMAYFAIFILILNIKKLFNKEIFLSFVKAAILFWGLSIGTIVPFVKYFFSDWGSENLQWTTFKDTTYGFSELIERPQHYFAIIFFYIAVLALIFNKELRLNSCYRQLVIIGFVTLIAMMKVFPWEIFYKIGAVETVMTMLQEAQRVFLLLECVSALTIAMVVDNIEKKKVMYGLCAFVTLLMMFSLYDGIQRFISKGALFPDSVVGNINSKDAADYLPSGTKSEWYSSGEGYVSNTDVIHTYEYTKKGTHVVYSYSCDAEGEYVEFPLFYYEGYCAEDDNGNLVNLTKSDKNKVRYDCVVTENQRTISIYFKVSKVYTLCYIISLLCIGILIGYRINFKLAKMA